MSIVFFGDIHLDELKSFSTVLSSGLNSRLVDQMKVVGQIAKQLRPDDTVIFLGDLINSYGESLKKIIYSAAFFTLKTWAKKCKELIVLIGNHDVHRNASIIATFDEIDKVRVVPDSTTLVLEEYTVDLVSWKAQLPTTKSDIFVGHVMPIGAWMGGLYQKRADEGVPLAWFNGYRYAIVGHCHEPQDLPVPNSETIIQCPGSILQLNLASSSAPRYIYRLENEKMYKIEIESPKLYTTVINTQAEADKFFATKKEGYHKLIATDHTIQFPQLDHTVVIEFSIKPKAGEQEIEDVKDLDLIEVINEFIDESQAKIDKTLVKEYIAKLY